jgi:hypothetical protein
MRLNEILTEEQLNEASWKDVASSAGRTIGTAAGGTIGAAASFGKGFKQGFKSTVKDVAKDALGKYFGSSDAPSRDQAEVPPMKSKNTGTYSNIRQPASGPAQNNSNLDDIISDISKLQINDLKKLNQSIDQLISKSADQTATPEEPRQGSVAQVGKKESTPGQRERGDMIRAGQNALQWTGEPGKEWLIAGGPLTKTNPQTDRINKIQQSDGKRYISAADAKRMLQAEGLYSNFLGIVL